MELYYKKYDGRSPTSVDRVPLLILHGIFGSGGNWHTLSKNDFSSDRDVYAIDQRNHGRSPHADSFSFEDMVCDLEKLMDRIGIEKASILGHSMGGKTAMNFALRHPLRVERLVVVDIATVGYPDLHERLFDSLCGIDPAKYSTRTEIDTVLSQSIASARVRQFLLKNIKRKNGVLEWAMNLDAIFNAYPLLRGEVVGWPPFSGETLFVRGDQSDYILDEYLPDIHHLFPAAEVKTISDTGHWLHAEKPDEFGKMVVSFLTHGSSAFQFRSIRP